MHPLPWIQHTLFLLDDIGMPHTRSPHTAFTYHGNPYPVNSLHLLAYCLTSHYVVRRFEGGGKLLPPEPCVRGCG